MFVYLFEVFEKFQTFFVGLLGFAGVIFTIIMNARSTRKQHDREVLQERTALRTALIAELGALRKTYEDRIQSLRDKDRGQSALIPEYVSNQAYCQLVDRIGLLSPEEIEPVMNAYILANELPVRLRLLTQPAELHEFPGYIHISEEHAEVAAKIHEGFLIKISTAVEAIQANTGKSGTKKKG